MTDAKVVADVWGTEFILFFKIVLVQNSYSGNEFRPPNSSDDLCLFFFLYPSSISDEMGSKRLTEWEYPLSLSPTVAVFLIGREHTIDKQFGEVAKVMSQDQTVL